MLGFTAMDIITAMWQLSWLQLFGLWLGINFAIMGTLLLLGHLPNEHSKLRFRCRFAFYYYTASFLGFVHVPIFLFSPRNIKHCLTVSYSVRLIAPLLGIKYILRNPEILSEQRGGVIISNHQSTFDILGMFSIWDIMVKCVPIAKRALLFVPPFGPCAYLGGVVFISRSNKESAYKDLQTSSDLMLKEKAKIWLYPEGTRNLKKEEPLLPFRKGAFLTAVNAQVPIFPVVYSTYYFLNRETYFFDSKSRVLITAMDPVPTKGLTKADIPQLMETVRESMIQCYQKVTKEVVSTLPADYPGRIK